jgi:NAD(P)-dependent dehydrogenase (short-subunit alcohol dehydrogenase family)
MTITLRNRTVIVTGGGRGIGLGYAVELASRGANVVVNDLGTAVDGTGKDSSVAAKVVEAIRKRGGAAVSSAADASSLEGTRALVDLALQTFGSIDGVVANAGIYKAGLPFENIDLGLLNRFVGIHLKGAWLLAQAAWPHFKAQGRGRIVFVTSSAGLYGMPGNPAYSMVKAGIIGLTRALAGEGNRFGIKVNAISPAAFSRMAASSPVDDEALLERYRAGSPVSAVAPIATLLLSDEVSVTGEILSVGSGRVGRVFVGETLGFKTSADNVSADLVLEHMARVADPAGAIIPDTPDAVFALLNAANA